MTLGLLFPPRQKTSLLLPVTTERELLTCSPSNAALLARTLERFRQAGLCLYISGPQQHTPIPRYCTISSWFSRIKSFNGLPTCDGHLHAEHWYRINSTTNQNSWQGSRPYIWKVHWSFNAALPRQDRYWHMMRSYSTQIVILTLWAILPVLWNRGRWVSHSFTNKVLLWQTKNCRHRALLRIMYKLAIFLYSNPRFRLANHAWLKREKEGTWKETGVNNMPVLLR